MSRDDGAGAGSILLAFILGAVSGAAVALLYAPASGRETREYLGEGRARARRARRKPRPKGREAMTQGTRNPDDRHRAGREAYQQARARENA